LGRLEILTEISVEMPKEKELLEDLGVHERIILKWV
jgi:hypothetical protein